MTKLIIAITACALLVGAPFHEAGADDALTIVSLPKNLFGGGEVTAQLAWKNTNPEQARVTWSLGAIDHRVVTRGEIEVPARRQDFSIRMQLPPVKDGVILPLKF